MKQEELFAVVPADKFSLLSRDELVEYLRLEQDFRKQLEKEVQRLRALNGELEQKHFQLGDQYVVIKNKLFGKSSERSPVRKDVEVEGLKKVFGPKKVRLMLPSERYPDAPLIERRVEFQERPSCRCCGVLMEDSGMTEDSEFLTVVPAQYLVVRQMREIVRCSKCYGDMRTAPAPRRIKEGSSYSDEMIVDVAMTKYCDLIPVERYTAIAGREGLVGLPAHSLIESTHYLSDFVCGAYEKLRGEICESQVLHADETPHRMLEGDKKSNWYMWGFSTPKTSYFELHSTRSGGVASSLLMNSRCEYLVSDVFSGYGKAVRDSNDQRVRLSLPEIKNIYCNAHARRKFKESVDNFPDEAAFFIDRYGEIYRLESMAKEKAANEVLEIRSAMRKEFESMRERSFEWSTSYSSKSSLARAMSYFLANYDGLTEFLKIAELPIDNNSQERLMRNPVIGRKTWYGTHSKRGAKTAATLFSLVESCKLNGVNPREYFKHLVSDIHSGKEPYTPREFANPVN